MTRPVVGIDANAAALAELAGDPVVAVKASSGTSGLRRELVGVFRAAYEAARRDRTKDGWGTGSLSADQAILPSREVINARSRQTTANNGYADAIAQAHRRAMSRITPMADARNTDGSPMTALNEAANLHFRRWACRAQFCDLEGVKTFTEFQGLAGEEFGVVGESLLVWHYVPERHVVGLKLQSIEPEQLDMRLSHWEPTGNEVRDGIELDVNGRRVAYHIHRQGHPLEGDTESVRVPASRVFHLMRQRRVRQSHGVSAMASTLTRLWDTGKYEQAELLAAWMEACVGLIDKSEDEDETDLGYDGEDFDGIDGDGSAAGAIDAAREQVVFEPGMIAKGNFEAFTPQHPSKGGDKFVRRMLMGIAAGTGFDYSTISKDFEGSYSSRRQGMIEEWGHTEPLEELQIDVGIGRPVWELFYMFAVLEGRLPLSLEAFQADPFTYTEADWQPRPRYWVDPAKEAAADKLAIDYRLTNRQRHGNRHSLDWRRNIETIAEIREFAAAKGVVLPEDLLGASGGGTSPHESRPTRGLNGDENKRRGKDASGAVTVGVLREELQLIAAQLGRESGDPVFKAMLAEALRGGDD